MTPADRATLRAASAHVVVGDIESAELGDTEAHHLFRVLRLRDGEVVTITDGCGRWRPARVAGSRLVVDGDVRVATPLEPAVTIAFAIPKRDRPDWIVQKLTELGVARIVLVHAARSVVRWDDDRAERHVDKLGRVAVEALQQSRGVWLPEIAGPVDAAEVLPDAVVAEPGGRELRPTDRRFAIGPEGGWTDDELALAADRVDLGPSILRVETAALALAARTAGHAAW